MVNAWKSVFAYIVTLWMASSLVGQVSSGERQTPSDWNNSGGPWWKEVGGWGNDLGCNCYADPTQVTAPGFKSAWDDDAVIWSQTQPGTAGVSLGFISYIALAWGKIIVPLPCHGDRYAGLLTNYLEEWRNGTCENAPNCPETLRCRFKVSYTIDATLGSINDGPVTWYAHSSGGDTTAELDRTDPNKTVVQLSAVAEPKCGGSFTATISWDGGVSQPTRTFQTIDMHCTKCDPNGGPY